MARNPASAGDATRVTIERLAPSSAEPAEATPTSVADPPTSRTFATTHGSVTLACEGRGPVAVILVAGTDDPISRWDGLVDVLGPDVLTCRYVPPDGRLVPATPAIRADALAEAHVASDLPGPVLFVAHSLGGITVRRFGDRHPELLGGALLLDATTPLALLSLDDVLRADGWDPDATRADADAPATWPSVPLTVLAHDPDGEPLGLGPEIEALWTQGQQIYVSLTADATFEQVPGTSHDIDRDAPARVVAEVDRLVSATAP